jgi:hypothetical protein
MTKRRKISPGDIIGTGEGLVNLNSQDFKALQKPSGATLRNC